MAMFFRKNFPDGSMNFLNISHGENTEAQKGHRAAPDFSILAAWRHQGKVASKIESYQKMKWYRENQEAAGNQAMAEKPGGFGKAKGGGGTLPGPPSTFTEREMRYFKEPCRRRAVPPRGIAAEGLRYQGALPPKGFATKGHCRRRASLPRGCAAKGLRRQGATPPRGYAAKRLCRQGAAPPRGYAVKGFYRLRGALRKGGIRPGTSCREPERLRPERPRS